MKKISNLRRFTFKGQPLKSDDRLFDLKQKTQYTVV